jgi:trigger factor
MGDFAVIRYSAVCDGKSIHEIAPNAGLPAPDKDFWLIMNEQAMAPGFCAQLTGANIGDRKQVLVDYPADFAVKELAGVKATFFVELKGIKEKKLPALDDALAQKLKEKSAESLKAKVREDIAKQKQADVSGEVRNQIMEHLLRSTKFDLPPQLLALETRDVVYDVVRENMMRGVTKESIDRKKDEIFGFAQRSAADRVRGAFILSRIAQEEKIEVTEQEIEARIEEMSKRFQIPVAKLRDRLDEKGGKAELEEQILRGKTLDFLEANAKVEAV